MANKYIIHGATYCGDGTASNEAASAGASGAWNDINVLEGTAPAYGALAAGDSVFIRSKTSAGADITRTLAANVSIGSANATAAAPICWILDAGTIWSGISGTLKYTRSNSAYNVTQLINNHLIADAQDAWVIEYTGTTPTSGHYLAALRSYSKNLLFDASAVTSTNLYYLLLQDDPSGMGIVLESPHIKWGRLGFDIIKGEQYCGSCYTLINPHIELTNSTVTSTLGVLGSESQGANVLVLGGRVSGAGATTGQVLIKPYDGAATAGDIFKLVGFDVPKAMTVCTNLNNFYRSKTVVEVIGCDGGVGGHLEQAWGYATSRTDNNPPTLAASLPDSGGTLWSWRVYPYGATAVLPMRMSSVKLFSGSAATKTITQEMLVADTMAPTTANVWMTVEYTDATTGLPKHVSTREFPGAALTASTAPWSATTWGMVNFVKRKLEITTPTSIKQDTPIIVTLWGMVKSATANDIYFVDPDFGVN